MPGGVAAGRFGGLTGSPIFGPALIGPFNHPAERENRIDQLANLNRRVAGKAPLANSAPLYEYAYGYPYGGAYGYGGYGYAG